MISPAEGIIRRIPCVAGEVKLIPPRLRRETLDWQLWTGGWREPRKYCARWSSARSSSALLNQQTSMCDTERGRIFSSWTVNYRQIVVTVLSSQVSYATVPTVVLWRGKAKLGGVVTDRKTLLRRRSRICLFDWLFREPMRKLALRKLATRFLITE